MRVETHIFKNGKSFLLGRASCLTHCKETDKVYEIDWDSLSSSYMNKWIESTVVQAWSYLAHDGARTSWLIEIKDRDRVTALATPFTTGSSKMADCRKPPLGSLMI
jgi:hypothetical protein